VEVTPAEGARELLIDSDHPTVSVVVATRDRPHLLRQALATIQGQDYAGVVETVLVFDQSDPDFDLVDDDERRPVKVIANTRTPGLAGARNSGAEVAKGELLAFCDDDDEWFPEKLRVQVPRFVDPKVGVVVSGIAVDYEGKVTVRVPSLERITRRDLLRTRIVEAHPSSVVCRRALFEDAIGEVDEVLPGSYGEDYEWLLRATDVCEVAVVQRALVRVLWHRTSFFSQRWQTINDALVYLLEKHPDFATDPKGEARILGQLAFANAALGNRKVAMRYAGQTLRRKPTEARAVLAAAVAAKLVTPARVMQILNARGKGI